MSDCNCGKRKKRAGIRPAPVQPVSSGWLGAPPPEPKPKEKQR